MQIFTRIKQGALLTAAALTLFASDAQAIKYTAILSGNITNSLTFGGLTPPTTLNSGDELEIQNGVKVTLDQDLTVSPGATITLVGNSTLESGTNASTLILAGGNVSGMAGSTIDVDSLVTNFTSGFSFAGTLTTDAMTSTNATIASAVNLTVNELLTLSGGAMSMTAGTLNLGNNTTIVIDGGTMTVSGGASAVASGSYDIMYINSSANTGSETSISVSGLTNVTINPGPGNTITLTDDLTLNGDLNLMSGELVISANELTLAGTADLMGSGTITGSAGSDLTIMTANSLSNSLKFTTGANTLDDLTIDLGGSSASVMLGGDLNVNGTLTLTTGMLDVGTSELMLQPGASISGGSSGSFVLTEDGGMLTMQVAAGSTGTFPVGIDAGFTPAMIGAASGSATSNISVSAVGDVMSMGTTGTDLSLTQPMVDATWNVTSDATTNLNLDMTMMWDASMEVNGFDRSQVFISHYTGGMWDADATSMAGTSGSMFSASRTGITSLSPFAVFDGNTAVSVENIVDNSADLNIYPNPAASDINITYAGNDQDVNVNIFTVTGQLVKTATINGNATTINVSDLTSGVYYIRLNGEGTTATQKFVKQ